MSRAGNRHKTIAKRVQRTASGKRRPGSAKELVRSRVIGLEEARTRATRLISANTELFRRLAKGPAMDEVRRTIRRTVKEYRKTLRKLASGPRRTRKA